MPILLTADTPWSFTGRGGRVAGSVEEARSGLGFAKYVVRTRGCDCCTLTWSFPFPKSEMAVEFAPDAGERFDPRMGLALGLILNDRARVRNVDESIPFWRS